MAYAAYWMFLSHSRSSLAEAPVSHFEKSSSGSNMASKTTGSDVTDSKTDPAAPNMTLLAPKGWSKTTATTSVKVDPVTTILSTGPTKTSSSSTTTATAAAAAVASTSAAKAQQKTTATTSVKVDPVTTKLSTGPTKTSSSSTTTATAAAAAVASTSAAKAQQKTTATTSVKVDPVTTKLSTGPTKTSSSSTTTTATAAAAAAASTSAAKAQQKIQVEVPPKAPGTKQAAPPLDPLDALGSLLPTEAPKRPEPKFTGPEVTENVTSEEGVRVGEREDTLPPGYRLQDMPPVPADAKPAEVPKPMSTADALDVLSMGFMETPPEKSVETISTASKVAANFAPAPAKKSDPAAPPADKKAKLDTGSFSLSAAVPATTATTSVKVDPVTTKLSTGPTKTSSSSTTTTATAAAAASTSAAKAQQKTTATTSVKVDPVTTKLSTGPTKTSSSTTTAAAAASTSAAKAQEKTTATTSVKVDPVTTKLSTGPTKTSSSSTTTTATAAAAAAASTSAAKAQQKIQVEVPPKAPGTKQAAPPLDPLDALGSLLPTEAPKRPEPKFTGPEVTENVTSEEGVRVGEREDTLPPGYRLQDMPPVPADAKPAEVPKPMSTADALDVLSMGFMETPPEKSVETISTASKVAANFAPAPAKKSDPAAPPADKKAKLDTGSFSLSAAVPADKAPLDSKVSVSAPKATVESSKAQSAASPTALSLDALSALGDLLPEAEAPKPEAPVRPEDLVSEVTVEEEEGVRVGEREDTLPPEYRLKPGEKEAIQPPPQTSLDSDQALDFLCGDFSSPAPAQVVSPAPPQDKKPRMETDGFSLDAGLTAPTTQASVPPVESLSALDSLSLDFVSSSASTTVKAAAPKKVESAAIPPLKKKSKSTKPEPKAAAMGSRPAPDPALSLDALSALGDLLPVAEAPKPEAPVRPEDLVSEVTVEEEEGVRVGEREDTLPPEYRLKPGEKEATQPPPQTSLDPDQALEFLCGDFSSSSAAPTQSAAHAQISADAAMNALSLDFAAPSSASQQSSECPPQAPLSPGADLALDALSDSLKDIAPTPQPEPPLPQNIIKEKEIEEERLIKMGERDDTLPPEFRPTEDELRKMEEDKNKVPEAPAEKPMDDKTALDLLAGDFSAPATVPATSSSSATVTSSSSATVCATPSDPTQPMPGEVLDSLYDSLLPDTPQFTQFKDITKAKSKSRSRTKKSPAEGTVEPLPAAPSSDVTPTNKS